jgi:hypothetical protein
MNRKVCHPNFFNINFFDVVLKFIANLIDPEYAGTPICLATEGSYICINGKFLRNQGMPTQECRNRANSQTLIFRHQNIIFPAMSCEGISITVNS